MNIDELKKKLKSYEIHFSALCHAEAKVAVLEKEKASTLNAGKSASDNDGMPHATTTSDSTFNKVVRMIEIDERIDEWKKEAKRHIEAIEEIKNIVNKIKDERQRFFVWTFYCRGEKLPIAGRSDPTTGLGKRQILNLLDTALNELSAKC